MRWISLGVGYGAARGSAPVVQAVRDLSFELPAGECLAIVGESGSGKTQSMLAPFGLAAGAALSGQAWLDGVELVAADEPARNAVRGTRAGFVFQDPLTGLAPHLAVGEQLTEGLRFHRRMGAPAAHDRALQLLDLVQLKDAGRCLRQYPHELSGGMRQRVMIAMALACEPALLVADEPTTALDATVQAEVLSLLHRLQRDLGMAMVFISHDLGAVARLADRVLVMKAGAVVEQGPAARVLARPQAAYTRELARAAQPAPLQPAHAVDPDGRIPAALSCDAASVAFVDTGRRWAWGGRSSITAVAEVSFVMHGARHWASWASRAAARARCCAPSSACRRAAAKSHGAAGCCRVPGGSSWRRGWTSRWCSRTRWPASTPASVSADPWPWPSDSDDLRGGCPKCRRVSSACCRPADWIRPLRIDTPASFQAGRTSARPLPVRWVPNRWCWPATKP
jgi:ABC-type dipeptide/oligopeptide/nickel transport system ATPase component